MKKGEDRYFVSEIVELPGCHTQAKTLDELMKRTKEVISLCLKENGTVKIENSFIGLQKIEV